MSALGDYIHLTAEGYERFGVNRPSSMKPNFELPKEEEIVKKLLEKLKLNSPSKEKIQEYENTINRFLSAKGEDVNNGNNNNIQIKNILHEIVEEQFKKVFEEWEYTENGEKKTLKNSWDSKSELKINRAAGRIEVGKIDSNFNNIVKKMEKLINAILRDQKRKGNNFSKIEDDKKSMETYIKDLYSIKKINREELEHLLSLIDSNSKEKIKNLTTIKNSSDIKEKIPKIIKEINDLIEIRASFLPVVGAEGCIAEVYAAAASAIRDFAVKASGDMILPDIVINGDDLKIIISNSIKGDQNLKVNKYQQKYYATNSRGFTATSEVKVENVRAKIDVSATWDTPKTGGKPDFNISVKNISLKKHNWITIVSKTPLDYLLESIVAQGDPCISNHWLNLASHSNRQKKENAKKMQQPVYRLIKLYFLYMGLTGDTVGKQEDGVFDVANVFLVANKTSNMVKAYSMQDIITNTKKEITKNVSVDISGKKMYKNYVLFRTNKNFINVEAATAEERINNLLTAIQNFNVTIKFLHMRPE